MVRRGVRLSAMQATLVSLLSLLSQNETVIFHSLKPSIILIKDVFENIIPRSPCFSTVLTMRLSRLVIMLILIYGHLFVSLGYNITAEPMAISVCRVVFARIINLMEAINGS